MGRAAGEAAAAAEASSTETHLRGLLAASTSEAEGLRVQLAAAQAVASETQAQAGEVGAEAAAKIAGVRKVLLAESDALGQGLAEAVEGAVLPLMGGYDAVLTPATSQGKNFSPRLAAKLDVSQISEIVEVVDASTFVRPIYAGNALETLQSSDSKKVITVRATSFKAAAEGGSAPVEAIGAGDGAPGTTFVDQQLVKSARPELAGAKIVVSGGRAMGSAEEFQRVIEPLADAARYDRLCRMTRAA
jgi:electron transfer flavoprotein alpha subunit